MIKTLKISELFHFEKGQLQSSKNSEGNYKFITASTDWKTHNTYTHDCEALLVAVAASGSLGRVHYVNDKFIGSDLCFILTQKSNKYPVNLSFYHKIFKLYKEDLVYRTATGSAKKAINKTNFGNYELPYFDLKLQEEFAIKLEHLGDLKEQLSNELEEQYELILKLRQGILQEAVQGKLTNDWRKENLNTEPASELLKRIEKEKQQLIKDKKIKKEKPRPPITKDEISYELPNGWEWCKLTDLVNVGTGSTPAKSNLSYYLNGTIPWYTSSATNDLVAKAPETFITDKALNETNCKIFPKGSLIIAMYGQGKTRGQISELKIAGATNQAIAAMVFYEKSNCLKDYLKFYFRKMYNEIRLLAEGGAQPNLNVGKIKDTLIPLPPVEEISKIESIVNTLMSHCDQLEKQVEESKLEAEQLMQAVLQEVFNPKQKENSDDVIEALFPDLETITEVANLQQAMIIQKTELELGSGRGKVFAQKTSANLKNIFGVDIPYTFEKSHHGEFSYQLSEDLDKNPYLRKVKTEVGEIYQVKNNKQQEVLNALNKPENTSFVKSIDELLKVYQNDLIKGSTDRIELLNTVWKAIKDTKSLIGNIVYRYLEEWEIKQGAYKTKADKFSKDETFAMINLLKDLGWNKK